MAEGRSAPYRPRRSSGVETWIEPSIEHKPLVSRLINKCSVANAAFDLRGRFGPAKRAGIFVPFRQPAGYGCLQPGHAVEAAAADGLLGDQGEPALHQVEPRGAGGREMELDARMGGQPLLYRRVFVGPVVVADQVQFPARVAAGQRLEEGDELLVPMATKAARVDLAAGHLQRRKQTGGAVTNVVVGAPLGQTRPHRQQRLGAVKRLDLRLFIPRTTPAPAPAGPDTGRRCRPVCVRTWGRC